MEPQLTEDLLSSAVHYCRGCGLSLPLGSRHLFHKDCLKVDKLRRVRDQRAKELERFLVWLERRTCPNCGKAYGRVAGPE